jgi:hypothetical protein
MDVKKALLWVVLAFAAINLIGYFSQPKGPHGVPSVGMHQSLNRLEQRE